MNKKFTRGLAMGLVMVSAMGVAFAAGTQTEIKATLDEGVKVLYNGKIQQLVDVNGVEKNPIMYQGTTYIPVRSAAEIFGVNVGWDEEARQVLLTENVTISLENDSLETIMESVYSRLKERPMMLANTVITDENSEYFLGLKSLNKAEAIASEPMVGSIAHSVALLRAPEGSDIEAIKTEIKNNINPRKWVCVGVEREEVIVDNIGNVIIMIIEQDKEQADRLHQGFLNLK